MSYYKGEKIEGRIEVTGNKDDTYYWKITGRKNAIKIHINGFSDIHRENFRCIHCNGAYQSKTFLRQHVLTYHYKKPKEKTGSQSEPVPSTSKAAYGKSFNGSKRSKCDKEPKKSSDSESDLTVFSVTSEDDDSDYRDELVDKAGRKKAKRGFELRPNSDYSDEDDDLSEGEMKRWLQTNYTPEQKLRNYACKTFKMRMQDVKEYNVKDFVRQWPFYFRPKGLYNYDFERKIRKLENMMNAWPNLTDKVISFAGGEDHITTTLGINIMRLTQDEREIASLMMLPNIIRSAKANGEWFSHSDSRNAFFRVVPHDAELAHKYASKSTTKTPEQPYILLTGKLSSMTFNTYNVVMDGYVIKCPNFLQAVDCCFKSFYVFDCEFPIEAEQIWIFLGCIIYSMDEEKRLLPPTQKLLQKLF